MRRKEWIIPIVVRTARDYTEVPFSFCDTRDNQLLRRIYVHLQFQSMAHWAHDPVVVANQSTRAPEQSRAVQIRQSESRGREERSGSQTIFQEPMFLLPLTRPHP